MIQAAIAGASGYTGLQLINLLKAHPNVTVTSLLAHSHAGEPFSEIFPSHDGIVHQTCESLDLEKLSHDNDVIFLALPHGVASKIITDDILKRTKIIDLGADFRLRDIDVYEQWYHTEHYGKTILPRSVYGLCEWYRDDIKETALLANPGCYTTASILALMPAVKNDLVDPNSIIIDAKSGVSGAGRSAKTPFMFTECNESIKAYGVTTHRHTPEIEQELSRVSDSSIQLTFTPHLVPMNRGILSVCYATLKSDVTKQLLNEAYTDAYANEYFIRLRDENDLPQTNYVKHTNYCDIAITVDERTNRLIVISAIDNLMKGASSQAVQNMNLMFGIDEKTGIDFCPSYI